MKIVKVTDFSEFPGPRYKRLGSYSGEEFRDDFLIPAINNYDDVVVDLDGAYGYGSSFLEEAFGGLLRQGVDPEKARRIAENLKSDDDESLKLEVKSYIEDAILHSR